jgi:hypothetical protein
MLFLDAGLIAMPEAHIVSRFSKTRPWCPERSPGGRIFQAPGNGAIFRALSELVVSDRLTKFTPARIRRNTAS